MVGIYEAIKNKITRNKIPEVMHEVFKVRNLEEFLEHSQIADFPQEYKKVEYEISQPIQIQYLNRDEFLPMANDDFDENSEKDFNLAEEIAMEHIKTRGSFFCNVVDQENPNIQMEMFGSILINLEFELQQDEKLIIPNPSIFIESQKGIGYLTVLDPRCYSQDIKDIIYQK